jgi:integrase
MRLGGAGTRTKGGGTRLVEVPVPRRAAKLFPVQFTVGPNEASALFCTLCDQLLIDDLTFHDTRATALTLLARRMDVMTLARISRHKDLNLLLRTYYRESVEDIANRI